MKVEVVEDKTSYDFNNFIGEVGGSLGFFLGASLFTLFHYLVKSVAWFASKKNKPVIMRVV